MKTKVLSMLGIICSAAIPNTVHAQSQVPISGAVGTSSPSAATAPGAASSSLSAISSPSIFDGSTHVMIPIHSFSLDGQNYGISLGYNTRGIKVDETATPAGLHWNIYAEGSITRVVKDLPDELNLTTPESIEFYPSSPNAPSVFQVNHKRFLKGKMITYTETDPPPVLNNAVTYRDKECDEFNFSCGGMSFSFSLGKNGYVFTHPHTNNIKITPTIDGAPVMLNEGQLTGPWGTSYDAGILGFIIRDAQGTTYYFDRGDYEARPVYNNEYGNNEQIGGMVTTSRWVIKKVVFASGNELVFNYGTPQVDFSSKYYKQHYTKETWTSGNPATVEYLGEQLATGAVYSSQLQSIVYPNGTQADFIYDANNKTELGQKMLNEIKISSGPDQCMRYKLNQAKVNDRWFLNSVKLLSCDGLAEEPYYSFEYNSTPLPVRFNSAQDYYGYFNGDPNGLGVGASGSGIMIPLHYNTQGTVGYGNERLPNPAYAVAGNLMKVKNAFGGEVSFTYGANIASNMFPGSSVLLPGASDYFMGAEVADGLRVESITEKDKFYPENSRITKYDYSGGQLFMPGGLFHSPDFIDASSNAWTKVIFQNMFLTGHQFIGGSNHGYSMVTEQVFTQNYELLGKKVTTFSNMRDSYSGNQLNYKNAGKHFFEYPYTDKQYLEDWKIGLPMKITEYDQNNRIVREGENFYEMVPDNSASANIVNVRTVEINSGTGTSIGTGYYSGAVSIYYPDKKTITDTYSPYTGTALLRKSKVKTYVSDTRFVADSTLYAYDSRNNLKMITTIDSKGEKTNTVTVYNYDVAGPGVTGSAAPGSTLWNMTEASPGLEKTVSTERWKQAANGSIYDQKLISAFINTFTYTGGILRTKAVYDLKIAAPLSYTAYTGMSMGSPVLNPHNKVVACFDPNTTTVPEYLERTTEVKLYDSKGNPLETQVNNMELYKSMIWDTDNGRKLAEVAGAQYNDIAYSGFEASNKGNLVYNAAEVVEASTTPGGAISGTHVLHAVSDTSPLMRSGLTVDKAYIISFWCYGGTPVVGGAGLPANLILTLADSRNGWSLFTAQFTPDNNTDFGFLPAGSAFHYYLDDVRIYPASATMQTYNHLPLFGMSSSADANSRITYYEYDKLGRQTIVRDQQGNIISKTETYNGGGL